MKIALTTDWILERDHCIEMLDIMAELYRDAELYAFAHKAGVVLGAIEERPIHSTFLSKKIEKPEQIFNYAFALPSLGKRLFIPCHVDAIVNISRGLSHGFKKCDRTLLVSYVYDLFWLTYQSRGLKQQIFWRQLKAFAINEFKKAQKIWVANRILQVELAQYGINSKIMEPFFKVEEYPLFPENLFKREAIAIETNGLTAYEREQLKENFKNQKTFFLEEQKCAGELAPILASSKVLLDFSRAKFPRSSLAMLSCGGRVLTTQENNQRIYFDREGMRLAAKEELLSGDIDQLLEGWNPDRKQLHRYANRFHSTRFKRKIESFVEYSS